MTDTEQTARRFIQAVQDRLDPAEIGAFLHPDIEQVEHPNRLFPKGAARGMPELLEGMTKGRKVLTSERYDVRNVISSGSQVVAEILWEGTTAIAIGALPAGSVMRAHICQVFEFEGGLIRRLRNYDCYEAF